MEDRWLVLRCKAGSTEALQRIWRKYGHDLLVLATAMVKDTHLAEDILQDVFATFAEGIDRFKLTGSLKSYLATCVANRARNCLRATQSRSQPNDYGIRHADVRDPSTRVSVNEDLEKLSMALAQLPPEQREVIGLHVYMDMSMSTIGKSLNLSVNTVKSRYRYGMDRLRSLLDGEVEE